jgi:hypothetical protein
MPCGELVVDAWMTQKKVWRLVICTSHNCIQTASNSVELASSVTVQRGLSGYTGNIKSRSREGTRGLSCIAEHFVYPPQTRSTIWSARLSYHICPFAILDNRQARAIKETETIRDVARPHNSAAVDRKWGNAN